MERSLRNSLSAYTLRMGAHICYADRQSRTTAYRGKYPFPGYIEVVCIRIASFPQSKYIIPAPL